MATLAQAKKEHSNAVEANRDLGVVQYKSRQEQSDAVYEVVEGCKRLPGGLVLGPGQRFHPTVKQIKDGSLRGKARELSASELRGMRHTSTTFAGADIGLRTIPMAESTLKLALGAGLSEDDFAGIEPGAEGRYTRAQVREIIAARDEGTESVPEEDEDADDWPMEAADDS